jgi:lipoprotein signal peptidase
MNILLSILLPIIMFVSAGSHLYFVWKNKDKKTFIVQITIICFAALGGILAIYNIMDPSISKILNTISPLKN